jgi:hypothetical protein
MRRQEHGVAGDEDCHGEEHLDANNKLGGGSIEGRPGRREEGQYQTYEMFVSNRKGPMIHFKERT